MDTEPTNVRARLSVMWVFIMVNMIYADILSFMHAPFLKQLMEGRAEQITITPVFLLIVAVVTEIPIAMVLLSRILPQRANRLANMIAAVFTIVYIWGGASALPHYIFIAGVETLACALIGWTAWGWRAEEVRVPRGDLATS